MLSQSDNWFSFHLLSEGDAGVLGKYNSHFSDDILAHLIGEPIPGNCFMWSAPKQPFVLPVRIRSFEELYAKNVQSDPDGAPVAAMLSTSVKQATEGAIDRLAAELTEKLRGANVKYVEIPSCMPGGQAGYGVKSGQLYYLIKEIKTPSDTTPENQLKMQLLEEILGAGAVQVMQHEGNEYYCATEHAWTAAEISVE